MPSGADSATVTPAMLADALAQMAGQLAAVGQRFAVLEGQVRQVRRRLARVEHRVGPAANRAALVRVLADINPAGAVFSTRDVHRVARHHPGLRELVGGLSVHDLALVLRGSAQGAPAAPLVLRRVRRDEHGALWEVVLLMNGDPQVAAGE